MAAGKSLFDAADDLGGYGAASSRSSSGRSWHSPRISFSNDFAQLGGDLDHPVSPNPSTSSGEFEFSAIASGATNAAAAAARSAPLLSADELFYKGKLLPLHLPPRIRMVQDLDPSPALPPQDREVIPLQHPLPQIRQDHPHGSIARTPPEKMRRERSLRSPARPSVVASTLKSSSYPPPGYSSRPSSPPKPAKYSSSSSGSSSRWRDLFGFQKKSSIPSSSGSSSSSSSSSFKQAGPSKLLKMIFNRNSGNGSSNSSSNAAEVVASPLEDPAITPDSALVPLLKDSSNSCDTEILALHSSSVSSSSSSNWAASSANSSSSSMDLPDETTVARGRRIKHESGRGRGGLAPGPGRRPSSRIGPGVRTIQAGPSGLQRSGSNRRASNSGKIQLQEHVLIGNSRPHIESHWRRSMDHHHKSSSSTSSSISSCSSSSVKVTPVLHVPACIGPSLRSVRVHGFRKFFSSSSSSSSSSANSSSISGSKSNRSVAVM